MKKVLITGANGNLGGALIKEIISDTDFDIIAVARNNEKITEMLFRENIDETNRIQMLTQDEFFRAKWEADIVVHMAFSRANKSSRDIISSIDYTKKVFEILNDNKNVKVVYISSQSVYGNTSNWRKEDMIPAPETLYSLAKYAGEKLLDIGEAGRYTVLRLDYVIQSQKLVPELCMSVKENGIINLKGGRQTFSYIDKTDVAKAIVALLQSKKTWKPIYNVGPNRMRYNLVEIAEIVRIVAEKSGIRDICINLQEEDIELWSGMDSSLFMNDTGWKPTMNIFQMVEKIYKESFI